MLKNTAPANDSEDICICFMIALGTDSGPILAPVWHPKSDQIGPKKVPTSIKKVIEKLVEFGIDFKRVFGQFWLPTWGAQGVQRIRVSGSSRLPEPPWSPTGTHPSSISDRSGSIWNRCWLDFESMLVDFWLQLPWLAWAVHCI